MNYHRLCANNNVMTKYIKYLCLSIVFLSFSSCSEPEKTQAPYSVEEKLSSLDGLPLRDFIDQSYIAYHKWYPQNAFAMGLIDDWDESRITLNSYDPEYFHLLYSFVSSLRELLENYDIQLLDDGEKEEYELYRTFLDQILVEGDFLYHNYSLSKSNSNSYISSLLSFFMGAMQIQSIDDAELYIRGLKRLEFQLAELDSFILKQEEMGIIMPVLLIDNIYNDIRYYGRVAPGLSPLFDDFSMKVESLGLEASDERKLLRDARKAIEENVQMGFRLLERRLELQYDRAPKTYGAMSLPDGAEYYRNSLARETWSNRSAEELFNIADNDLKAMQREMYGIFDAMGYDVSNTLYELFDQLDSEGDYYKSDEVLDVHRRLIIESRDWVSDLFHEMPETEISVEKGRVAAQFVPPGTFYSYDLIKQSYEPPSQTFREIYPGHHLRQALQKDQELSFFHSQYVSDAYTSGWAIYAEDLMDRTGYYENDPMGRLGYLRNKARAAAYVAADVGVHLKGWSMSEAMVYVAEHAGILKNKASRQIAPVLTTPGVKAAPYAGFIELRSLLEQEQERMGEDFEYRRFHKKLLDAGPLPFDMLKDKMIRE